MLLAPTVQLLALLISAPGAGAEGPVLRAAGPELVFTRQTLFSIPFRIDRTTEESRAPVEVRLYVSTDRGANWQLYSTVPPAGQHFLFRAGSDGEYWFLVRTLDRSGKLRPENRSGPELKVVVDTRPPKLKLRAERGRAGQITARWEADEAHPKANSLKIQYRADSNGPWEFVALDRSGSSRASQNDPAFEQGEVTWWPQGESSRVEIRAEMTDMAGNPAVSHAQVGADAEPAVDPADRLASSQRTSSPGWQPATPGINSDGADSHQPRDMPRPPSDLLVARPNPAVGNQFLPPDKPQTDGSRTESPADDRLRMVNSLRFELDYDVESIGASRVGRVELWGTRDGGLTWRSYGIDEDQQSPIRVTVPDEGRYGFRAAVTGGPGSASEPPRSGEAADVWIAVDVTKPVARIVSATLGTGDRAGHLVISWEAADNRLADQSVSLKYGGTPRGPWSTIAGGLDSSGSHAWPLDGQTAGRVYLRLEARDEAGNIGSFQTPQPVLLRPAVRIRDVRPLAEY